MKILGIHYFFPPTRVVASRRLWYFYRDLQLQLEDNGEFTPDSIQVITSEQAKNWTQENEYAHTWKLHHVAGKGLREYLISPSKATINTSVKSGRWFKWAAAIRHSFPFAYLTDEGGPIYRDNAYARAVELIESENITHLISSYRPWVDHLIATKLKKRFPHLIWWADFRDLPIDIVRKDVVWPGLQRWFAKRTVSVADLIVCVSRGQAEQLIFLDRPVEVVYNGIPEVPDPRSAIDDDFVINYTGSIYPELQSLKPLGEALTLLLAKNVATLKSPAFKNRLKLRYAGKDGNLFQAWAEESNLSDYCEIHEPVPQQLAREWQQTAAINLLLSWSAPNYYGVLTAKLFDYLAAEQPILALVNGPADPELTEFVEGKNGGKCVHTHDSSGAEIADWLAEAYTNWCAVTENK